MRRAGLTLLSLVLGTCYSPAPRVVTSSPTWVDETCNTDVSSAKTHCTLLLVDHASASGQGPPPMGCAPVGRVARTTAFAGAADSKRVWHEYLAAVTKLINDVPFSATLEPDSSEYDEACFVRDHAATKILESGFENNRYCFRILPAPYSGALQIRMDMDISVAVNPNSPYHEPDNSDMAHYREAARQFYAVSIRATCDLLRGKMDNNVCVLQ